MPRIQITCPQEGPQKFSLPDDLQSPVSIGRSEECDLCLSDGSLSDFHATLELHEGYYYLIDQNSTNGIVSNGVRVPNVALVPNVEVLLGEVKLVLLPPRELEAISDPLYPATVQIPAGTMAPPPPMVVPLRAPAPQQPDPASLAQGYPTAHFPSPVPSLAAAPMPTILYAQQTVPSATASASELVEGGGFKRFMLMAIYLLIVALLACYAGATYRHYEVTGEFLPLQILNSDASKDSLKKTPETAE